MRVFYYSVFNNYGGIETFAKNLISTIRGKRDNIAFTIITSKKDFPYKDVFEKLGCEIVIIPPLKKPLSFYRAIKKVFMSGNKETDVIQLNICTYRNGLIHKAAKKSGLRTIVVGHYSSIEGKLKILHYLNRFKYRKFAIKTAVSQKSADFMFGKNSHALIIDNGINSSQFAFDINSRNNFRKELGIENDELLFGQIGRYAPEKNQMFTIKVFEAVHKVYPRTKICFVGSGDFAEIRKYAAQCNISDSVIFGYALNNDITKWYNAMDVFLMPSKHEAFPLTLLEALANGLPSFVSNIILKLNIGARVTYLDENVDEWVKNILFYLKNNKKIEERKDYVASSRYLLDVCADSYIDLYFHYDK